MTPVHDSLIDVGLQVRETEYVGNAYVQRFDHFGAEKAGRER